MSITRTMCIYVPHARAILCIGVRAPCSPAEYKNIHYTYYISYFILTWYVYFKYILYLCAGMLFICSFIRPMYTCIYTYIHIHEYA